MNDANKAVRLVDDRRRKGPIEQLPLLADG
jgi:hypothetical protein